MIDIDNRKETLQSIVENLRNMKKILETANNGMRSAIQRANQQLVGNMQDLGVQTSRQAILEVENSIQYVEKSIWFTEELSKILDEYFQCVFEEV